MVSYPVGNANPKGGTITGGRSTPQALSTRPRWNNNTTECQSLSASRADATKRPFVESTPTRLTPPVTTAPAREGYDSSVEGSVHRPRAAFLTLLRLCPQLRGVNGFFRVSEKPPPYAVWCGPEGGRTPSRLQHAGDERLFAELLRAARRVVGEEVEFVCQVAEAR